MEVERPSEKKKMKMKRCTRDRARREARERGEARQRESAEMGWVDRNCGFG